MSKAHHIHQIWPAPAKLNLFLHITGRRADGYHLLQTVFQFLDHGDELHFQLRDDGAILRTTDLADVPAEQDLVVRAARLLQETTGATSGTTPGSTPGVEISLNKKLPMGGGLGGGSSDAATVLVALNQLWECGLELDALAELGLQLGADVPVFVRGQAAWAEGVGEALQPVELPERWFVVLIPPVNISTAKVFSDPQLIRDCPPITIRDFLSGVGENICEPVVRQHYPQVETALQALAEFAPARMTGTGACVFSAFDTEAEARAAWQTLAKHWQGFVARGQNLSPLYKSTE